jgi:glycosyltransferase involved in cell wall biosynthesis
MSLGIPVAAHRLPQTESLAGDTIAYAADMTAEALAAAIADLLESPERARALGSAARRRFDERISWARVGQPRLLAGYDRLFGRRPA